MRGRVGEGRGGEREVGSEIGSWRGYRRREGSGK